MLRRVRALPLCLSLALLGCSGASSVLPLADAGATTRDAARSEHAPEVMPTPEPEPAQKAANLALPAQQKRRGARAKAPEHGCVVEADQSLCAGEQGTSLLVSGRAGVVAFQASPAALSLWLDKGDGTFDRGPKLALESQVAHAAAACAQDRCELAWVDERMRLLALEYNGASASAVRVLASGVDRRFAPAVTRAGELVHYAFTKSVGEAMHTVWLSRRGSRINPERDLTPEGHGAAAGAFVLGAPRPTLVFIDAHAGISPLLELGFDAKGEPGEPVVRTPVSQPYAPPLLSAVQWDSGQAEVMFSAVGRLAMTAIARVPLRKAEAATALVPSKGYGALAFSAARSRHAALFALEVPTDGTPEAPRTIMLKRLDGQRTDDGPAFPADARNPSVASGAEAGQYTVSYVRDGLVHAALVLCDD